ERPLGLSHRHEIGAAPFVTESHLGKRLRVGLNVGGDVCELEAEVAGAKVGAARLRLSGSPARGAAEPKHAARLGRVHFGIVGRRDGEEKLVDPGETKQLIAWSSDSTSR